MRSSGFVILASVWSQTNLVSVYPTSQFPISTLPPTHSNPLSSESFVLQNISWPKSRMRAGPLCTMKMFACARGDFLLCRGLHGLAFYFLFFGSPQKQNGPLYLCISIDGAHSPLVRNQLLFAAVVCDSSRPTSLYERERWHDATNWPAVMFSPSFLAKKNTGDVNILGYILDELMMRKRHFLVSYFAAH